MRPFSHCFVLTAVLIFALGFAGKGWSQGAENFPTIPKDYAKDYMFFQTSRDAVVDKGREYYRSTDFGYGLKYSHILESDWIVGLRLQRRPYIKKNDQPFSVLSFVSQTQRVFRLYDPFYALVGTELSFIAPLRKSSPPFAKDPDLNTEIGAGLNLSFWWFVHRKAIIELHFVRWRGTGTETLHGFDTTIGLGFNI